MQVCQDWWSVWPNLKSNGKNTGNVGQKWAEMMMVLVRMKVMVKMVWWLDSNIKRSKRRDILGEKFLAILTFQKLLTEILIFSAFRLNSSQDSLRGTTPWGISPRNTTHTFMDFFLFVFSPSVGTLKWHEQEIQGKIFIFCFDALKSHCVSSMTFTHDKAWTSPSLHLSVLFCPPFKKKKTLTLRAVVYTTNV